MDYLKTYEEIFINFKKGNNKIKISTILINILQKIVNNQYSKLFLSLPSIDNNFLIDNHPDYLDVDKNGNISYLESKYIVENEYNENYFLDVRRQKIKVTRILFKIIKPEYINITQPEIERFSNIWKLTFDDEIDVIELKGDDILRAYNFTNEVKFGGGSCALYPYCGSKERFDILTKNDNFSAYVAIDKTGIIGRRLSVGGIQTETFGMFKKGEYYKILNNFYGKGGNNSLADLSIREYAKDTECMIYHLYYFKKIDNDENLSQKDIFRIKIENTYQKHQYPAIDNFIFNFNKKEISNGSKQENGWVSMYGAFPVKSKIYDI